MSARSVRISPRVRLQTHLHDALSSAHSWCILLAHMDDIMSPRFRYRYLPRILWGAGFAVLVVGAVVLGRFVIHNQAPPSGGVASSRPAQVYHAPKNVPVPAETKRIASLFVETAVRRVRLAVAYRITAPALRGNMTLKQWMKGDIPVVPFPAQTVKYKVMYSHPNETEYQLALFPPKGSYYTADVFTIDVHRYGPPGHKRWLVSYYAPTGRSIVHASPS
jgi:hypothetical protein